jgi:diaminohydroxyphosphoribosylaminopyrimidine deaminase/5-amino-6-(5-phosphoribosylamino)uracil reductase
MTQHTLYMARAITLAKQGVYTTQPNPCVGCVIVKDDKIIGEGFHLRAGEGHAEVNAIADAKRNNQSTVGATAYVTLEPCSHYGRTPPCSQGLIDAGIKHVVCAMQDPNPQVSGRGFEMLSAAGIEVESGVLEDQARALNTGFIKRMSQGLPYVSIKSAMSIDGRTAMASGESQWITGPSARAEVQRQRAKSSAIITGIESILHDDSSLTVRADELGLLNAASIAQKQPLRVVLDTHGRLKATHKITQQAGLTLWVTSEEINAGGVASKALENSTVEHIQAPLKDGHIDLHWVLKLLAKRECNNVLVETGATLAGAFIQEDLADELIIFVAMKLMGSQGRPLFELPLVSMAQAIDLTMTDCRQIGDDLKLTLNRKDS